MIEMITDPTRLTRVEPNERVLRLIEKCVDVLLTDRVENHEVARTVITFLEFPQYITTDERHR